MANNSKHIQHRLRITLMVILAAFFTLALQGCGDGGSSGISTANAQEMDPPTDGMDTPREETAFCSRTADELEQACGFDARDDFLTFTGDCINITDATAQADCKADAEQELVETQELCTAQFDARISACGLLGEERYDPQLDPVNFVDPLSIGSTTAPNPFFPLSQGNVWVYEAGDETVTVTVTEDTVEVAGITCVVVVDVAEESGEVIESTDDYYAQDISGNVWYCGELVRNFEDGMLDNLDGSFRAGVDRAKAGIINQAMPVVGDVYRQEWALAEAEDIAEVVSLTASEVAPGGNCTDTCLQTREFNPLEPEVNEFKFYLPGVGLIVAFDTAAPEDREELVSFTTAP